MAKSKRKHGRRKRGKGRRKKRSAKRRNTKKLFVKKQFKKAIAQLHRMRPVKQREAIVGASNRFIRDISGFMNRIRKQPHLVKSPHQRILKKHRRKLRKLVNAKTPINAKRAILYQHVGGQLISVLVPIIVALIGAGGSIGGSAVAATMMKN